MKRNFSIEGGVIGNKEKLAVLRIVNAILTDLEKNPGKNVDETIHFADCSAFQDRSEEEPWATPLGDEKSATTGFVIQGNSCEDGEWYSGNICTIIVPALAELTAR